ncbi:MAG: hypothetical protein AABP62_20150 [Planctomycetota bacterium]
MWTLGSSWRPSRLALGVGMIAHLFAATAFSQEAVRWLDKDSNAVLAIDVAAAYRSPIAKENQWAKKAAESFIAQEVFLPPSVSRVTIGTQLELNASLDPVRQHCFMELKPGTDLDTVAALAGGSVEKVGEHRGLAVAGGRYVVEAGPQKWLMVQPGGRQAGLRWARSGAAKSSQVSVFLTNAVESVSEQYPIVVALDLSDVVTSSAAKSVLEELPGSPLKGDVLEKATNVLASVQGVVCRVHLGTSRVAQCRIEFGQSAAPLQSVALPLVQAVLNLWGASLEDSTAWKAHAEDYALVFDGEITATGLKRLISVVHPPNVSAGGADAGESQPAATIAASQKYLHSIKHEMDELRATVKKTRDNHALWFERAARSIDELPLKNVDQDLQVFGGRVSSSLRYQGQTERMSKIRKGTRQAQTQSNTFFSGVGSYGEVYRRVPGGNSAAISAEENEAASSVKFSESKQIEDGMVEIRRKLTQKYNHEF